MDSEQIAQLAGKIIMAVERRVPEYVAVEEDRKRNEGNSALCIIDENGGVRGKMFGTDKILLAAFVSHCVDEGEPGVDYGNQDREYEKLVFTGQIDDKKFGIIRPDFIGWEGGQPIAVDGETRLSVGFSGFRGSSDLDIVQKAMVDVLAGK